MLPNNLLFDCPKMAYDHRSFWWTGSTFFLKSLASHFNTTINDKVVKAFTFERVRKGDVLEFGSGERVVSLTFEPDDEHRGTVQVLGESLGPSGSDNFTWLQQNARFLLASFSKADIPKVIYEKFAVYFDAPIKMDNRHDE